MLVTEERKQELTLFPDQKAVMDIALHVASYMREHAALYPTDELGKIRLSRVTLEEIISDVYKIYGKGWSKHYREGSIVSTTNELIDVLYDWEMLEKETLTDAYLMKPLFGRVSGNYPKDFA